MHAYGAWNLQAPPGFQGLREDLPLRVYDRHLPHWRQDGATYFVTFRLTDSLPQTKLRELEAIKREWRSRTEWHSVSRQSKTQCHSVPREGKTEWHSVLPQRREELTLRFMEKVERWLDQGMGHCCLKLSEVSRIVADALHHFDGRRYELGCYVVMPNHVHTILRPLDAADDPLEKILQSRKQRSSRQINRLTGRSGCLWHDESFDRIVRDEEHLYRCIQYIGRNPRKAGIPSQDWVRWIQPAWEDLGWRFNDP